MNEAADLRVAATHRQEDLIARQLGLRVDPQGILTASQADAFGLGQAVDTVDDHGGLRLGRQLFVKVFQFTLGHLRQFQVATFELLQLRQRLLAAQVLLLHLLPVWQYHCRAIQQGQQHQGSTGQANHAQLADTLMDNQAMDGHCRSPR
ncbi:hypothetical protein D3C78_1136010 [compost metagenome]